jgi:hypothetical protein
MYRRRRAARARLDTTFKLSKCELVKPTSEGKQSRLANPWSRRRRIFEKNRAL